MAIPLSILLFMFFSINSITIAASISLIHRDSVHSPYYNPKESVSDRMDRMIKGSSQRITYLFSDYNSQLNLCPSTSEPLLFVNFSIGQPPIPQLAIMDTGSSLLWIQCIPCSQCSQHTGPVLDPLKSSTYANLPCHSRVCRYTPNTGCNTVNECTYSLDYVKGGSSRGVLATELLLFDNSDETVDVVDGVVFGCSHENGRYKDKRFSGIFGLGGADTSLVTQMGSKFSYCLGDITDPHYYYNHLVLGDAARFEGYSTPLEIVNGHYIVTLEGISVGEKMLLIKPAALTPKRKDVIIDTGTAITWLARSEYRALEGAIRDLLDGYLTPFARESYLCYKGELSRDLIGFPVVTFHFSGGADLDLETRSLFYQATSNIFCMAVREISVFGKSFNDFSVIGLMAQQYYNIAVDIIDSKLFLQRIDCELLE